MTQSVCSDFALRPLVCMIERQHCDVAIARDVRNGRFTHLGMALDLGRRPDWRRSGLAEDEEWRIEWVKLYEGLDLAHAFSVNGDVEFLRTWEDLVESFCDQVTVGHDSSDVSARRVQNWMYAWARFAGSPHFPGLRAGLAHRIAARIEADVAHLAGHLTAERNHRTLELYTLLLAAIGLGRDRSEALDALALLAANATADIWDDGVHRECSTDYHLIVLRSLVGAIANARQAGLPVPPDLLDAAQRGCDFALHVQRPDGLTPALSDGDQADFRPLLADAADLLDRPDLAWAATAGAKGSPPVRRHAGFPVGGYFTQRSGWGDGDIAYQDERFAIMDCGPLGDGGHGHYDQLSVELFGGGRSLVVDPGRFTYSDNDGEWRRWFKGTAAHNTVTVDGLDQTSYRPGRPKGPVSTARLLGRWTVPGLDVVVGEVRSPSHDAVHTRALALVDDDYWLVHDRLRGRRPHRYEARWHLAPEAQGRTHLVKDRDRTTVHAPGLLLAVPRSCGDVSLADGWVSPSYGVRLPAPVVVITVCDRVDADIVTVVTVDGDPC